MFGFCRSTFLKRHHIMKMRNHIMCRNFFSKKNNMLADYVVKRYLNLLLADE